jgi:hypothetical protein
MVEHNTAAYPATHIMDGSEVPKPVTAAVGSRLGLRVALAQF